MRDVKGTGVTKASAIVQDFTLDAKRNGTTDALLTVLTTAGRVVQVFLSDLLLLCSES